jgi:hypothetical protein
MLSNHIKSHSPSLNAVDVPVHASIIITFDATVAVLKPAQAIVVVDEAEQVIAGTITFNESSRSLAFVPTSPLPSGRRITVRMDNRQEAYTITNGGTKFTAAGVAGFSFSFTTQSAPPVRLFVQLLDRPETRTLLTTDVVSLGALDRIRSEACARMDPPLDTATIDHMALIVGEVRARLARDSDVAQLRDNDQIALVLKGQGGWW